MLFSASKKVDTHMLISAPPKWVDIHVHVLISAPQRGRQTCIFQFPPIYEDRYASRGPPHKNVVVDSLSSEKMTYISTVPLRGRLQCKEFFPLTITVLNSTLLHCNLYQLD